MVTTYFRVLFGFVFCILGYLTSLTAAAVNGHVKVNADSITIPPIPPTPTPYNIDTHLVQRYLSLPGSTFDAIEINAIPESVGFFVVQVHSFLNPVVLSNSSTEILHTYVKGTNVGLVQFVNSDGGSFRYYVRNHNFEKEQVLVVITLYDKDDPVPGGCNLTFDVEVAPYQFVNYTENMVYVDAQAPSITGRMCEESVVRLEFFQLYLSERDPSMDTYYDGLEKMLTVKRIRENGWRIKNKHNGYFKLRTYYSAYPGTGAIYAIVAVYKNRASAYVPAVSYACDRSRWSEDCVKPVNIYWQIFCAVSFFWGLFVCYYGHRFFKLFMFTSGFIFGGFVTYVISTAGGTTTNDKENFFLTIAFGFAYGLLWVLMWWRCGKPVLSVFLPVLLNGALLASLIFYLLLGDISVFQNDLNYWAVFAFIIFCYGILQIGITVQASLLSSSMIGSFAAIMSLDHYVGSNLRYILFNTIRRATVLNFNLAVIHPPLQSRDIILYCLWFFLIITGVLYQWYQHRGKPPFPPPTFFDRTRPTVAPPTERTPLIRSASPPSYSEVGIQRET